MRSRGRPVRCHNCKTACVYIDGTLWSCWRCGGVQFTLEDPAFRRLWWEQFNDFLGTNHMLERLESNPVIRRALFKPRQPRPFVEVK